MYVPRDTDVEGNGYVIALLNRLDVLRSDLLIFGAKKLAQGPLATIHLPFS